MESFNNNFHEILFWILSGKENKEAGTICFEVRIPRIKNQKNVMEWFHQKLMECMLSTGLWFVLAQWKNIAPKKFISKNISFDCLFLSQILIEKGYRRRLFIHQHCDKNSIEEKKRHLFFEGSSFPAVVWRGLVIKGCFLLLLLDDGKYSVH